MRMIVALVGILVAASAAVYAQGFSVAPSFGISEMYDDNLFYRPAAAGDMITRVSSRVDAAFLSELHAFSARYALDADRFADHPDLTTMQARLDAGFEEQYHATRRLTFNGTAAFIETETPSELNLASALTPGRARACRGRARAGRSARRTCRPRSPTPSRRA